MLEIGRDGKRFERFIGKLPRKKVGEAFAEFFARKFAGAALKFPPNEFKPVWFDATEALDGQRQPLLGMVGNREDAAREVKPLRPQMQERLLAVSAYFPGHSRKRRNAAAVLAHFDNPGGGKLLEAGLQFSGEFH